MRTEMKYLKIDPLAILQYWHKPPTLPNPHTIFIRISAQPQISAHLE